MQVVGLKGWLKIKRRTFWSYRYAAIDDCKFQYQKNPTDILRGWVDLRDCQVFLKKVFPNEQVIVIKRLKGSNENSNKLRKAKEYQLKLADDQQTSEWFNQINKMLQQNGHQQQQDIIISDKLFAEYASPSKSNKGSNVDQLKDYLDINNLETEPQIVKDQIIVAQKVLEQSKVQDRRLVDIYGNVNVYASQNQQKPTVDKYKMQIVLMLVALNLSNILLLYGLGLVAINGFVIYFQLPIIMSVFYLMNFRKYSRKYQEIVMEVGINCNVNEIVYVMNDHNQSSKWKANLMSTNKQDRRIVEHYNDRKNVQYSQTIFHHNSNIIVIHYNDKPCKMYQIQINLSNLNQQQNTLKMMVFEQLEQQELEEMVAEMQGLKNYIEMERYQQMSVLNQYCIQQKYMNMLDNESDDDQSVNSSIFRSNVAVSNVQQYPSLDDHHQKVIDEQDEFKSDKGDQPNVQEVQMTDELLKQSDHGRNLLLLKSSMSELKCMKSTQHLLNNGYTLFAESDGIQIYSKLENSINHIVSNGVMKFRRQEVLDCIGPYEIKQQVDKMFDSGEVIDYQVPDTQKQLFDGFSYAHQKFKGIFPVQGRDFIIAILVETVDNATYIVSKSVEMKDYPNKKGYTRGEVVLAGWILEDLHENGNEYTKAYYISNANPKGNIPDKLKQMMTKKQGMTIDNYAKYLQNKKK